MNGKLIDSPSRKMATSQLSYSGMNDEHVI